jgi:hypothetical protein
MRWLPPLLSTIIMSEPVVSDTNSAWKHSRYYASDDLLTFKIAQTLYRVPKGYLETYSEAFSAMFLLPQGESNQQIEGRSEEHPIVLPDMVGDEFEALLDMIYAKEFSLPNTDATAWLKRLAAASRWDAPLLRATAIEGLGQSHSPVVQLAAARRFDIGEWIWPALFAICMRAAPLSATEIELLVSGDLATIMDIRETIRSLPDSTSLGVMRNEMHVRYLLSIKSPNISEPLSSALPGPRSGYRMECRPGDAQLDLLGEDATSFEERDGSAMFVGSARLENDTSVVPCNIRAVRKGVAAFASFKGTEKKSSYYNILKVDLAKMEWVPASGGIVPGGRMPVEGGYEPGEESLYHAYGLVGDLKVPGMTCVSVAGAVVAYGGKEWFYETDYFILVWR